MKSLSRVQLLVTPWTAAYQAPPSMRFSGQEYWSGMPLPSPRVSSVQFSRSVVSDSLRPHVSQHARPPCPSPSPGVHIHRVSDAIQPSHPRLSPSPPAPNPSPQSLPASDSFPMSQLFSRGGQTGSLLYFDKSITSEV